MVKNMKMSRDQKASNFPTIVSTQMLPRAVPDACNRPIASQRTPTSEQPNSLCISQLWYLYERKQADLVSTEC